MTPGVPANKKVRPIRSRPPQYRAVIRFSIFDPDWGGWRATNSGTFSSAQEYREWLWSDQRMNLRFAIFGQYAAPLYQAIGEHHDFRVLVQHSADLPAQWLDKLRDLERDYPALRLVELTGWQEARDTVHSDLKRDGASGPVVMLRVDDDDLLSTDFLDLLEPHVRDHRGWCISLGRGLACRVRGTRLTDLRELHQPFSSVGQAYVGSYRRLLHRLDLSPLQSHRKVSQVLPTVVDSREVAFIQVRHPDQDTRIGTDPKSAERSVRTALNKLEPVTDTTVLRTKFPTLSAEFDRIDAAAAQSDR